jgi:hypothetical protein
VNPHCEPDEVLAAFVDGRLNDAERARVVSHLADCSRCREVVSSVVIAERKDESRRKPSGGRWFVPGLAAAAAIVVGVGILSLTRLRPAPPGDGAVLVEAVGNQRTIEPRIAGGFAHGPVPRVTRGAVPNLQPQVLVAIAKIDRVNAERPTFETRRARAQAYLVERKPLDSARLLEALTRERPGDAASWSDLAAAHLTSGTSDDAARALAAADRALAIDGRLPEALFNRALALEALGRTEEARTAWLRSVEVESVPGWAEEGRQHLARLRP